MLTSFIANSLQRDNVSVLQYRLHLLPLNHIVKLKRFAESRGYNSAALLHGNPLLCAGSFIRALTIAP